MRFQSIETLLRALDSVPHAVYTDGGNLYLRAAPQGSTLMGYYTHDISAAALAEDLDYARGELGWAPKPEWPARHGQKSGSTQWGW